MFDYDKISIIALDVDDTLTTRFENNLLPEPVEWISYISKKYTHIKWALCSNQGGVGWRVYCELFKPSFMTSDKIDELPTSLTAYNRLNVVRTYLEKIVNSDVWIMTSFAYQFKKTFDVSQELLSEHKDKFDYNLFVNHNLFYPYVRVIHTHHFACDLIPKPSPDMLLRLKEILKPTHKVLFIGDADGSQDDFYGNPRTEDIFAAFNADCLFSSPNIFKDVL